MIFDLVLSNCARRHEKYTLSEASDVWSKLITFARMHINVYAITCMCV